MKWGERKVIRCRGEAFGLSVDLAECTSQTECFARPIFDLCYRNKSEFLRLP